MKWWTFLNWFCDKLYISSVLSINLTMKIICLSQHNRIYNHPAALDTCTRVTSTRAVSTIWTRPPAPPPTPGRCWGWAGCCPTSPSPPRTPSSSASTSKHCWLGHKWQLPARFQIFVRQKYFSDWFQEEQYGDVRTARWSSQVLQDQKITGNTKFWHFKRILFKSLFELNVTNCPRISNCHC